jgi:hypothetical protein
MALVSFLLFLFWLALAFVALRVLGTRYLGDRERGTVVAVAVVIAFALGRLWPYSQAPGSAPPESAGRQSAAELRYPLSTGGSDERSLCDSSSVGAAPVSGHVDLAGIARAGFAESQSEPIRIGRGEEIVLMGWATERAGPALARAACLAVDGKVVRGATTRYHLPRPDLAASFNNKSLGEAGFQIVFPASRLTPGKHSITVSVVTTSGKSGSLPQTIGVTAL